MIKVIRSVSEFLELRKAITGTVGFVPTMGALHEGHASLLDLSVKNNNHTVLSIFINPTQFNDKEDFEKYPQTFEEDKILAEKSGADILFYPQYSEIYADQYRYKVCENEFSNILCGAHRPGHFDGVLTVVMKLLNIVKPDKAYFGEKDYQQLTLIKDMVQNFFMPVEIVSAKTVREASGLAKSSRNARLSEKGKEKAALIYQTLINEKNIEKAKNILIQNGFQLDYLEDHANRRYIAAFLEGVRLIDNVEIEF